MDNLFQVWVYLSASPLFHLTLTLVAYQLALYAFRASGNFALLNPVLVAVVVIITILTLSNTSYETYFDGAQFVHFLLGPATVSLAVPLYRQLDRVKEAAWPLIISLCIGSFAGMASAVGLLWWFDLPADILASAAPKSVTSPVAMAVAEQLNGIPALAVVFVMGTGITGAAIGPAVLSLLRVTDQRAAGFAIGTAAHGVGTARALQIGEVAGAFSGLAMGLNALVTALALPLIWPLLL
ncbi:hypothetical protein BVC71_08105 [Marivivens niveibacter]|uniref:LrgB family protein n=1 Tax=Marivivens niveibacter TaxID=1930667 RepID=A0A251X081_9RHOB|nr:LrgB family protein [Marivivens niveibacter]OUD09778.1 hypothetical protein BVC71_08105 [Marivivens niveibacter]